VVGAPDCGVREPRFESHRGLLCLSRQPLRYATLGTGCAFTAVPRSVLHPSGVAKSSTSFGWGKGGNVTPAGWQVTLSDPTWHVIPVAVRQD